MADRARLALFGGPVRRCPDIVAMDAGDSMRAGDVVGENPGMGTSEART